MRPFFLAANWKMFKAPKEAREFLNEFKERPQALANKKVIFFVSPVNLTTAQVCLTGTNYGWGPQNTHWEAEGAFTGETSPRIVADMGATHGLVGHSERRTLFSEDNALLAKKLSALQAHGITPVYCIGENLQERKKGETLRVLGHQLTAGLAELDKTKPFHIAYEPVWAIGTGEVATPAQVEQAHLYIRKFLAQMLGDTAETAILYGGSVKPDNAGELAKIAEVGGFLIGGASLNVESFSRIIEVANP